MDGPECYKDIIECDNCKILKDRIWELKTEYETYKRVGDEWLEKVDKVASRISADNKSLKSICIQLTRKLSDAQLTIKRLREDNART